MQELTPAQALEYAADREVQWLDVRESWEFEIAHLPEARLVPLMTLPGRVGGLSRHLPVIVYCHHGVRSRMAANWLEQNGFEAVINLTGGIDAWSVDIDSSLPRY